MKKLISAASVICLIAAISVTPVYAHGHRQNYTGHYYGDGHDYHGFCDVTDCTLTGYHEHEGTYYFGHSANDGHNYHSAGESHRGGERHH